jgi:putative transposase
MKRAYRFRLYPKAKQAELLEQTLTLCRRLYNAALEHRIVAYRNGQSTTYLQQQNELPAIKKGFPEYASVHSQVLQETLRRLDRAYQNFFRRVAERRNGGKVKAGFPRFKSERMRRAVSFFSFWFMSSCIAFFEWQLLIAKATRSSASYPTYFGENCV